MSSEWIKRSVFMAPEAEPSIVPDSLLICSLAVLAAESREHTTLLTGHWIARHLTRQVDGRIGESRHSSDFGKTNNSYPKLLTGTSGCPN